MVIEAVSKNSLHGLGLLKFVLFKLISLSTPLSFGADNGSVRADPCRRGFANTKFNMLC